jgi:hypothetical protein
MRTGSLAAIIAATVCATAASASDVRILALPDTVRGAWAPDARACMGSEQGKIDIAAREHSTSDASCRIAWITVTASRDGPTYSARSVCVQTRTGQPQEPSYLVVTPRPDDTLLVRGPNDERMTYRKCL